jgi:hypothetical protein
MPMLKHRVAPQQSESAFSEDAVLKRTRAGSRKWMRPALIVFVTCVTLIDQFIYYWLLVEYALAGTCCAQHLRTCLKTAV